VPNHKSKCRHIHGHRYRFEAEIEGDTVQDSGVSEEGMLMDFSDVSAILMEHIHDVVDHAFVVYEGDLDARKACEVMGEGHRTVVVPFIPTAENLAKWAFEQVQPHISTIYGNRLKLVAMHVRETPKSTASWIP
jgi:6-pyruvoyltetrahydropterin/6-carboxytetrahydropterin synthase